jgi:RHS repeat-associated protein
MKLKKSQQFFPGRPRALVLPWLAMVIGAITVFADPAGNNSGSEASLRNPVATPSEKLNFHTDLFTGRFGYQVPLELAPGRNDSQPKMELDYDSSSGNGICGIGWQLDLGYIQRQTKYGVPILWSSGKPQAAYDDSKGFLCSLNGRLVNLENVGGSNYRAEIEGAFLRFNFQTSQNQWQVIDPSGNTYYFGQTTASRMVNSKSGWSSGSTGTFRWNLTSAQTPNGDTNGYTYQNISGTLYPLQVTYNGSTAGASATHEVDFVLGSRSDVTVSYISGYRVEQNQLIQAIVHKVSGNVVWSNRLTYASSPSTSRSLLQSVTKYGTNLTSALPTTTFTYTVQQMGFQPDVVWTNLNLPGSASGVLPYYQPSGFSTTDTGQVSDLLDMDGDGLPDRVTRPYSGPWTNLWVQHNNGHGFDAPVAYPLQVHSYVSGDANYNTSNLTTWNSISGAHNRMMDLNGDGIPDRILDPLEMADGIYNEFPVELASGSNFSSSVSWTNVQETISYPGGSTSSLAIENGDLPAMMDLNGDGLPDRVVATATNFWVQFNTGSGFGPTNTFGPSTYFGSQVDYRQHLNWVGGVRMIDINGDGLPDRVMFPTNSSGGINNTNFNTLFNYVVEFNNGAGFEPPVAFNNVFYGYSYSVAGGTVVTEGLEGTIQDNDGRALIDLNGDGLPDRVFRTNSYANNNNNWTNVMVQWNLGTNFSAPVSYGRYTSQGNTNNSSETGMYNQYVRWMDINGDGIPDRIEETITNTLVNSLVVSLGKGPVPDRLISVSNGMGGSIAVTYVPSSTLNNHLSTNDPTSPSMLPFLQYVVSSTVQFDGFQSSTNLYNYEGGYWDAHRKEFHGFAKTTEVDPLGMTNIHWFHQSGGRDSSGLGEYADFTNNIAKSGLSFRTETYGTNGQLYKLVLNKVEDVNLGNGCHYAFVTNSFQLDYASGASGPYRAVGKQFLYDTNSGNLISSIDYGEVSNVSASAWTFTDIGTDTRYHTNHYAALSNTSILDKPDRSVTAADSAFATVLQEMLNTYDGATGNLLMERQRICDTFYQTNSYGYDSYGNRNSSTSPAGVVTSTTFDSTYHEYPSQETEGSTLTSYFTYDARSGKVASSTDPRGLVTANQYDVFLRLIETDISTTPNGTPSQWITKQDYNLGGVSGAVSANSLRLRKVDDVDTSNGHETWSYSDGWGHTIQVRDESETSGSYRVTDTLYDRRNGVVFVSQPYFSSGTANTQPVNNELGIFTQYDPVARVTSVTIGAKAAISSGLFTGASASGGDTGSPVGAATTAYVDGSNPWTIVSTDEATKVHKYVLDAYGRTNQVIEVTSAGNYTTTYSYDLIGNLTNITDNAANSIQFAYNDLGTLVAMADPDMGRWDYIRDFAGRMRDQLDAKTNTVHFDYTDALGRLKTKTVSDPNGNFMFAVTNTYDSNGGDSSYTVYPGQLFRMDDSEGWEKFSYDFRGRVIKSVRYLFKNGQTYTNQFVYDNADRVRTNIYPNFGPTIQYTYDAGGNLSTVKSLSGITLNTTFYTANSFDALGHLTQDTYGNGLVNNYGYYANSARLKQITGTFQNLTYTYDIVSDVAGISDSLFTGSSSATISTASYDDLHRLIAVTRATGGATNFAYNSIGNVLTNGESGVNTNYGYGVRMPHAVKTANGKNYAYDANGSMIVRDSQRFDYDAENRLTTVTGTNKITFFGYAGNGARLWKQTTGTNTLQLWIGDNYEEKQGQILFHVLAAGQMVCTFDATGTNVYEYYHADNLHSSSVMTDHSGNRVQHYEYSAYGRDRFTESTNAFSVTRRYTSQKLDEDTGLYFYGARYYDQQLARFTQPDDMIPNIFEPQSLNRYSYVRNNPLKYTDPTGHWEWPAWTYNWIPDSVANYLGGGASEPRPGIGTAPNSNLRMLQEELGGYDASGLHTAANVAQTAVNLTPVGTFNSAYTAGTGNNAISPDQKVSRGERMQAGAETAASALPFVGTAGKAEKEAAETFEIIDGVRRAKAADLVGKKTITAQILDGEGKVVSERNIPLDALRSPNKSSIDMTSQTAADRFMRVQKATQKGDKLPPIQVTPGNRGVNVKDVQFNTTGD